MRLTGPGPASFRVHARLDLCMHAFVSLCAFCRSVCLSFSSNRHISHHDKGHLIAEACVRALCRFEDFEDTGVRLSLAHRPWRALHEILVVEIPSDVRSLMQTYPNYIHPCTYPHGFGRSRTPTVCCFNCYILLQWFLARIRWGSIGGVAIPHKSKGIFQALIHFWLRTIDFFCVVGPQVWPRAVATSATPNVNFKCMIRWPGSFSISLTLMMDNVRAPASHSAICPYQLSAPSNTGLMKTQSHLLNSLCVSLINSCVAHVTQTSARAWHLVFYCVTIKRQSNGFQALDYW